MFRCQLWFYPAPYFPVPGNNDITGNVNAVSIERFVVFPCAVVHIHEIADHVPVWGKRVVRWQYLGAHRGARIGTEDTFRESGLKELWLEHRKHADRGDWDKYLVGRETSVVAPLLKQRGNVFDVSFAVL